MEINKQLFEDILSGKLKGAFILKNGVKISSERLSRNVNKQQAETYPYNLLRRVPYLTRQFTRRSNIEECGVYDSYTDTGDFNVCFKSDLDIMDFEPAIDKETKNEEAVNTQNLTPYYVYGFWNIYKDKPLVTDENYKPEIRVFGDINGALSFINKQIEKNLGITWCITSNFNSIK
jgi:hypothetical protein